MTLQKVGVVQRGGVGSGGVGSGGVGSGGGGSVVGGSTVTHIQGDVTTSTDGVRKSIDILI